MSGSIDKEFGKRVEAWKSIFVSFAAWAATLGTKSDAERTVAYKPEKGKGSKDAPRTVVFGTRHIDAIVSALRFNAFDEGIIDANTLEKYDLWDATKNQKGKIIGKKVAGKPIAEAIGVAKLLGCPITSLPTWKRKTKESKAASFIVDVDADEMVKMLDALTTQNEKNEKNGKRK